MRDVGAVPVSDRLRALPRHFQLALCMRLGAPISDLAELPGQGAPPAVRLGSVRGQPPPTPSPWHLAPSD